MRLPSARVRCRLLSADIEAPGGDFLTFCRECEGYALEGEGEVVGRPLAFGNAETGRVFAVILVVGFVRDDGVVPRAVGEDFVGRP